MNKEYNLATAFIQFKKAYQQLVQHSKTIPSLDVSDGYPFYLLDFEKIEPQVVAWCTQHASKLLTQVPDRITNPACLTCKNFKRRSALFCSKICLSHPEIPYSKDAVSGVLTHYGLGDVEKMSDAEAFILYLQFVTKLDEGGDSDGVSQHRGDADESEREVSE